MSQIESEEVLSTPTSRMEGRLLDILSRTDLLEIRIKYERWNNTLQFKALFDCDSSRVLKVTREAWDYGECIRQEVYPVSHTDEDGTGPAAELFDSLRIDTDPFIVKPVSRPIVSSCA